jgi:hypothetical protein
MRPRRSAVIAAHSRGATQGTSLITGHCSCFMPVARLVALQASLCQPPVRAPWRVCCLVSAAQSSKNKSTPAWLAVSSLFTSSKSGGAQQ